MDGLLIRLLDDKTRHPGRGFWQLFGPIRNDLDRMYWCLTAQPWMALPMGVEMRDEDFERFEGYASTSVHVWRPGVLSRFAGYFSEEWIELWAMEPTRDNPTQLAKEFDNDSSDDFIRGHGRVWLLYTNSTCWEIYARKTQLLETIRENLWGKPGAKVYLSHAERRKESFGKAGLSETWNGMYPDSR